MCGCPEMESYEEFCLRTLALLQEEGKFKKKTREPLRSLEVCSAIRFHGRAVLSPLLSAKQHSEMCGLKRSAVQLEEDRRNQQRNKLLTRVQVILDQAQAQILPSQEADELPVSKSATVSGYTLITDSPGLPRDPGFGPPTNHRPATPGSETPVLNGFKQVKEAKVQSKEKSEEEEDDDEEDISLDSLLKRSREYVKREQSQHGAKSSLVPTITQLPLPEPASSEEDKSCSPVGDTDIEFGFSLHHSPIGAPQIQHPALYDISPHKSVCLSPSLPEPYVCLPCPESSISPRPQRRRPRPVSTGNIHISFPIGPADLIPRNPGRSGDGASVVDWGDPPSGASMSPGHWDGVSSIRRSSHCCTSPVQEACNPASASVPSSMGHRDHLVTGFRRRCHTLDSQLHTYHSGIEHIDRSQERVPRFMAGVTWMAPSRHTSAVPINQTYEVEDASPSLRRPCVMPELTQTTPRIELDELKGQSNGRKTPTVPRNTSEIQANSTDDPQWRAQALEDMKKRLGQEHALQMSLLLAEQEKEQQRLQLELEDTERRLKEQRGVRPLSADAGGWNRRSGNDSRPVMSPSCPGLSPIHTPSERSPGHSTGFSSPIPSSMTSPSVQRPIYLWGSSRAAGKPRARQSLVLTAEQQRAFCRISAIIRGFLTRRLLKTEKLKHLRQTILDTQEFIRSFKTEASQKRSAYSAQDLSLQERVRAQLRAALYDIHDIFFEMPLGDRLALLQQERELRTERKLRDMEKTRSSKERVVLSAATQRSLDRKKRVGESPAQVRKVQQKPKSPTINRVLKPSQGQNSPLSGQLNRQGSWYRKTPEERVRRTDSLKKQHSLG